MPRLTLSIRASTLRVSALYTLATLFCTAAMVASVSATSASASSSVPLSVSSSASSVAGVFCQYTTEDTVGFAVTPCGDHSRTQFVAPLQPRGCTVAVVPRCGDGAVLAEIVARAGSDNSTIGEPRTLNVTAAGEMSLFTAVGYVEQLASVETTGLASGWFTFGNFADVERLTLVYTGADGREKGSITAGPGMGQERGWPSSTRATVRLGSAGGDGAVLGSALVGDIVGGSIGAALDGNGAVVFYAVTASGQSPAATSSTSGSESLGVGLGQVLVAVLVAWLCVL